MSQKKLNLSSNKKIFLNKNNLSDLALKAIGFIKLEKFAIEISFLEYIFDFLLYEKREIYNFNFYHLRKLKIPFLAFYEILRYYKLKKIAGTNFITFWKKIEEPLYNKKTYDNTSPFYVLKKLQ